VKTSLAELLAQIPGAPTAQWPQGDRFALGFEHGTMSLGYYAPVGTDPQRPHKRDEIYIVQAGSSEFYLDGSRMKLTAGDAVFVPAGASHHFEDFSSDFGVWVVFWGPEGGESSQAVGSQ
jgi:mannose-6-phosphate isomerase-like protein (cupin superfamily)